MGASMAMRTMAPSGGGRWGEDDALVRAKRDAFSGRTRIVEGGGKEWMRVMRPGGKGQFLGCIAEVERDQQPVVAGSTLVSQEVAFGLDQRDGADGQRG